MNVTFILKLVFSLKAYQAYRSLRGPQFGEIRTFVRGENQEVWFVGKEVAELLGYKTPQKAILDHVDSEDKGCSVLETPGGNQRVTFINESGLYSLILSSKLPQAREFKHWVTSEVLPAIRKSGGYMVTTPEMSDEEILARGYMLAMETIKQRDAQLKKAHQVIAEQKPMVEFAQAITASDTSILIGDLAKLITQNGYEIGPHRLFTYLRKHEYLFKNSTRPTQQWVEKGLFEIHETLVETHHGAKLSVTTKVTPRGQRYFLEHFGRLAPSGSPKGE